MLFRSVEIEAAFLLDVQADEGGIGDTRPVIIDVGEFAFGRLVETGEIDFVIQPSELEQNLGLGDEGARVGRPNAGPKA